MNCDALIDIMDPRWMIRPDRDSFRAPPRLSATRALLSKLFTDLSYALGKYRGGSMLGPPASIKTMFGTPKDEQDSSAQEEIELDASLGLICNRMKEILSSVEGRTRMLGVRFLGWILGKLWRMVFQRIMVDANGVDRAIESYREAASKNIPIMLMPTHRSHIDYLLMSYIAFGFNLPIPHIAAGDNLKIPVVGTIFSYSGAFFIRRSFKGDNLYKKVLHGYILRKLVEGSPIEVFVEGGRTRTGMISPPKVGMIVMALRFIREGRVPDCLLLPASIDYELVLESDGYANQLLGTRKKAESLSHVLQSGYNLVSGKTTFGQVYANFAKAISMREIIDRVEADFHAANSVENEDSKIYVPEELIVDAIGDAVVQAQRSVSYITPVALVALVLLGLRNIDANMNLTAVAGPAVEELVEICRFADACVAPGPQLHTCIGTFVRECIHILSPILEESDSSRKCQTEETARRRLRLRYCCGQLIPILAPFSIATYTIDYFNGTGATHDAIFDLAKDLSELVKPCYPGADWSNHSLERAIKYMSTSHQSDSIRTLLKSIVAPTLAATTACANATFALLEEHGSVPKVEILQERARKTLRDQMSMTREVSPSAFPESLSSFEIEGAVKSFVNLMLTETNHHVADELDHLMGSPASSISIVSFPSSESMEDSDGKKSDEAATTNASEPEESTALVKNNDSYQFYSSSQLLGVTLPAVIATLNKLQLQGKTPGVTEGISFKHVEDRLSRERRWSQVKWLAALAIGIAVPMMRYARRG